MSKTANETKRINTRLKYLRGEIEAERISYGEIAELQDLADHIDPFDVLLMEWADVPEKVARERQTVIMYMHTMNGRPAGFDGTQLLYASEGTQVSHYPRLCATIAVLAAEQRKHVKYRKQNNWDIGILGSQALEVPQIGVKDAKV